ncbi:MAG: hypothetical protein ACREEJ_04295 [Ensifer adhaerens]
MFKTLQSVMHGIWVVSIVGMATAIGIAFGWQDHGWVGAAACGFVGYCAGALLASSPSLFFDLLRFWSS